MSHRYEEGRARGLSNRDADRYGHAGGPAVGSVGPTLGPELPTDIPEGPIGTVPEVNPDRFWVKINDAGDHVPASPNEAGAWFDYDAYADAKKAIQDVETGFDGGGGPTGPTPAELAIQQANVDAKNLATFIDSTINQLSAEIDVGRLKTDQAVAEFNRRLDAFSEAGQQFQGLQPFTIPRGVEFVPGFEPGGIATQLGLEPFKADPILIDPFQMAADIVAGTPNIADIGVPETDLLEEAVQVAQGFL